MRHVLSTFIILSFALFASVTEPAFAFGLAAKNDGALTVLSTCSTAARGPGSIPVLSMCPTPSNSGK